MSDVYSTSFILFSCFCAVVTLLNYISMLRTQKKSKPVYCSGHGLYKSLIAANNVKVLVDERV